MKQVRDWRKGVWEFILEHSRPIPGGYTCFFGYTDRANFWERVENRADDQYHRELVLQKEWQERLDKYQLAERIGRSRDEAYQGLREEHPIRFWVITKLRQLANHLLRV